MTKATVCEGLQATRSHTDQPAKGRSGHQTLVSVVTVVRNHRSALARTMQSVRCQTYPWLEFPFDTRYRIKADRDVQVRMALAGCRMQSIPQTVASVEAGGISARAIPRKEWENVAICLRHRVGLRWTGVAILLAVARVSLFGLARMTGLDWETAKAFLSIPAPDRIISP